MNKSILALAIGAGVLLMTVSQKITNAPRGIRNNNPGNIRENDVVDFDWLGEADTDFDPEFEEFKTPEAGIRAMMRILNTYRNKYGAATIASVIYRWAPPKNAKGEFENDTAAYIASVEKQTGINRDATLTSETYPALIAAIIRHENGVQPYTMQQINAGIAAA